MELHKGDRVRVTKVAKNGNTRITTVVEGVCHSKEPWGWYSEEGVNLYTHTEGVDVEVLERAPLAPNKPLTVTAPDGSVGVGFIEDTGLVVFYDVTYRYMTVQKDYLEEMGYTVEYYTQG